MDFCLIVSVKTYVFSNAETHTIKSRIHDSTHSVNLQGKFLPCHHYALYRQIHTVASLAVIIQWTASHRRQITRVKGICSAVYRLHAANQLWWSLQRPTLSSLTHHINLYHNTWSIVLSQGIATASANPYNMIQLDITSPLFSTLNSINTWALKGTWLFKSYLSPSPDCYKKCFMASNEKPPMSMRDAELLR